RAVPYTTRYSSKPHSLMWALGTERAMRESRRKLRSFRWSGSVAITISSPSMPTHAAVTCGEPSAFKVTTWATASLSSSSLAASGIELFAIQGMLVPALDHGHAACASVAQIAGGCRHGLGTTARDVESFGLARTAAGSTGPVCPDQGAAMAASRTPWSSRSGLQAKLPDSVDNP